jgi:hypothetical protein
MTPWKFYKKLELNAISSCLVLLKKWDGVIWKIPFLAWLGLWNGLTHKEDKMENNEIQAITGSTTLLRSSTADLRGKQSVRATFKLSKDTIDAIRIIASHLCIKQKSLFDHLVENIQYIKPITFESNHAKIVKQSRIQKTYVISRKSLSLLDKILKDYDVPRDILVEYAVQSLLPIINKEREKHNKRKKIFNDISQHLLEGQKILRKSEESLGEDDPVYDKLETAMTVYENAYRHIESFIEKGKIIENFQPVTL